MADKESDAPRNKGFKAAVKRAFQEDTVVTDTTEGFLSGITWSAGEWSAVPLSAGAIALVIGGFGGMMIDGQTHTNLDEHHADTSIQAGFDNATGYYAIDTTDDSKNNPHILVKQGDTYRLYSSEVFDSNNAEWTFITDQTEAWRQASQTLQDLRAAREALDNAGTETPRFLPQFKHFEEISGLYADHYKNRDQVQRQASIPEDGLAPGKAPVSMDAELDRAITYWEEATQAIRAGQYGFDMNADYTVIGETQAEGPTTRKLANPGNTAFTTHPQDLPEQHRHEFSDLFSPVMSFYLKALGISTLGLGVIGGAGMGIGGSVRRRRRKKEQAPKRK